MVGSYVLAGEIANSPSDIPLALQRYVETLRPYVNQCQKLLPGAPQILFPQSALGVKMIGLVATVVTAPTFRSVVNWVKWFLPDDYQRDRFKLPKRYAGLPVE